MEAGKDIKLGLNIIYEKSIPRAVDFASQNGFSAVELWTAAPQFHPEQHSKKRRTAIAKYAQKGGVTLQIHGPEHLSFFADHPFVREAYLRAWKEQIDFAKDLKARSITIHPGAAAMLTFPGGKKISLVEAYPKYFFKFFRENLERAGNYAKGKMLFCIENTDYFERAAMNEIEKLLRKNLLYLTLDSAKLYNRDGSIKKEQLRFFVKNRKKIKNVHLHDATKAGGHEIIGKGFVDFEFLLRKFKDIGANYIIEVRPRENVLKSKSALQKLCMCKSDMHRPGVCARDAETS